MLNRNNFFYWSLFHVFAQTNSGPTIVTTLDRGDYFFILENALANSVDGIVYQDKGLKKDFVAFLKTKVQKQQLVLQKRQFGAGKGFFVMSDDFDKPLEDFRKYI